MKRKMFYSYSDDNELYDFNYTKQNDDNNINVNKICSKERCIFIGNTRHKYNT